MEQNTPESSAPQTSGSILHGLSTSLEGFSKRTIILFAAVVIVAGIGTGYVLSTKSSSTASGPTSAGAPGVKVTGNQIGIQDKKTFRDCAKGQLEKGGISGEGTHHLVREGGPSQTAYLTSSVVDLDQFVGKSVEVCGETIASKRAGWLMDIGLVNTL